jgi:hypothetical protein
MSGIRGQDWEEILDGVYRRALCEINGLNKKIKKLLVMTIDSDMNEGRRIAGSISRSYESVGNPAVYRYFEQLFRSAVRRNCLPFRRVGVECAGLA